MPPEEKSDMTGGLGRGVDLAASEKCLDLRCNPQGSTIISKIEWFDAERVTGQEQSLPSAVPDCEGVHSSEMVDHFGAAIRIHVQEHFGIAAGAEAITFVLQARAKFPVVVDFAVEGNNQTPISSCHGLAAGFGEINDGKTAVSKT